MYEHQVATVLLMVLLFRLSRIRKRANHEANKIIFAGLTAERGVYITTIDIAIN